MMLIQEDNSTSFVSANAFVAAKDAASRAQIAKTAHKNFFESSEHLDRLDAVSEIIRDFFGHNPNFFTPRGVGRGKPFENVKVADVGRILSKTKTEVKNAKLYGPLLALKDVEVISKNGHLIIRVYPVTKTVD